MTALLRRILGEPLLQFAFAGALIFAFGQWFEARRVVIPAWHLDQAERRMAAYLATPALSPAQRLEADMRVLGDELLYREALRRGLDRDDLVIRQHLAQKLLLLTEETELAGREPAEAELQDLYRELAPGWHEPSRFSFCHVYSRTPFATGAAARLPTAAADCPAGAGEAFPLGPEIGAWSEAEMAGRFGPEFALAVATAPAGAWIGPLSSRFGWHLVRVRERIDARTPPFEEKRAMLVAAWTQRMRERARHTLLRDLALAYRAGAGRSDPATPEGRLALAATTLSEQEL
ncbi:MAG: peptidyl-prolyl cis-trans isomerase [Gammaproteobacteria bacterium]|nr:peptidyl-prolyl cis-trans isomerase [Gammaproteobacteria bacterium]